ncbi:hypothetical protein B0A49_10947 [Cryomyces minteri]|uniref:Alkaline phosphatase n=1 Tax=Cryomyces minteri TaxID=331657 RepID=A0A4V5NDQ2_9PEZI|nr:hypothetical protein B0A49_10947 [Cryomyces minteri]
MVRGEEPLLVQRPSSEHSSIAAEEEEALLTGERTTRNPKYGRAFWREVGLFAWATIATAGIIILAVVYQKQQQTARRHDDTPGPSGKRNLIFMVSDGMGPTSLSLTRSFRQHEHGLPWEDKLVLDGHLIGQSRTRSTSSLVTDSAAGATAFSCGMKSYNGAISVLPDHSPCGTVLEAAKKAGYMTGLVVTTRITDATPACFAAHVNRREEEDRIAEQMVGYHPLGRVVDLMLGAGRCHFLPNGTRGSCRADGKDVVTMAKENGFNYVDSRAGFDGLKLGSAVELPLLGLFADQDIPFEIDRRFEDETYPALDEMAKTATKALAEATRDSDKGFFLMIEGSRIDHAGHANDPAAQVHEVLAYDKAFSSVLEFLEKDSVPGVMVSTSDHETGGLSAAKQLHTTYPDYLWYPGALANASHSSEHLARQYFTHLRSLPQHGAHSPTSDDLRAYLTDLLATGLGVHDATSEEMQILLGHPEISFFTFADIISRRSQTGWSTHGHSAVDVNIYASDARAAKALAGNHENTEVGEFLARWLDVDVGAVTKELREKGVAFDTVGKGGEAESWMGRIAEEGERLDGWDHLDHAEGDFGKMMHRRCSVCGI